mgnify:CR=1 FL=1
MRKILTIIFLSFLWSNISIAKCIDGDCVNGKGTFKDEYENTYIGGFKDGKKHGVGIFSYYADDATYVGKWKNDKFHGQGILDYGTFKREGEWKNGELNGKGIYTSGKKKYVGEFKDNRKSGQGTYTFSDGLKYTGEWKNDNENGQGTITFPNGNTYFAEFKDGIAIFTGKDAFTYKDGKILYKKDEERVEKPNGEGTLTEDSGTYVGQLKDNEKHGQGTMTYTNGIKYVGVWDEGWATSQGTFTFVDGTTFVGSGRDYIQKQYEKLSNKDSSLNGKEILELCKEYRVKDLGVAAYDNYTLNVLRSNTDYCRTTIIKSEFKIDAKNNFVKELDIGKIKFNLISNEDYSVTLSESEITKSSTCHIDIENESSLTYLQIYKRCGVEIKDKQFATGNWISITDYFYADANNDDYMDLIIRFKDDGSYSMRPETMTAVITSVEKGKFININYKTTLSTSKNYYNDYLTNCSQSSLSYSSFENADILEVEIFKGKKLDINCLIEKFENHQKKFPITSYLSDKALLPQKIIQNTEVTKSKNDNAQYVKLELSSIADQKCGETCVYTTEALLIYDDTFWYIKGNNNRGLKAILESKNKILITNFMSTHQRQYTFANNKIKRVKKKIATKKKKTKEVEIVQGYKGVLEKQVAMKTEALTKNYNADLFDLINKKDDLVEK